MSKPLSVPAILAAALFAAGCTTSSPYPAAEAIYTGGDIVTVNDAQPTVEAIAVKDGLILAAGPLDRIERDHKTATTRVVDLQGKTLLPGFIDPHSHYFSALSVANQVNVFAPPAGPGKDVPAIVAELKQFRDQQQSPGAS